MDKTVTVAELFAGVGGFRLALEGYSHGNRVLLPAAGNFSTIWANQWEPPGSPSRQFAADCYKTRFGKHSVINKNITEVLEDYSNGLRDIPSVDMVVGGFPCQDYSVARSLSQSGGIYGKKGVLWWEIYKFLTLQIEKSPANANICLFENVDRLLKSPASQRGRDFAVMLCCLSKLGYSVEWRVINSAAYGFSQRRKRIYIYARRNIKWTPMKRLKNGVFAKAFPYKRISDAISFSIPKDINDASNLFNIENSKKHSFHNVGVMINNKVTTFDVEEIYDGPFYTLGDILSPEDEIPSDYFVANDLLPKWKELKGAKSSLKTHRKTGQLYRYAEGSMAFPDLLTNPSRTILTGEGGASPSRFKHIIKVGERYRRLVPDELDQLQGFPKGWTNTGMSDNNRAFCMGNALVVGVVNRIGKEIYKEL